MMAAATRAGRLRIPRCMSRLRNMAVLLCASTARWVCDEEVIPRRANRAPERCQFDEGLARQRGPHRSLLVAALQADAWKWGANSSGERTAIVNGTDVQNPAGCSPR